MDHQTVTTQFPHVLRLAGHSWSQLVTHYHTKMMVLCRVPQPSSYMFCNLLVTAGHSWSQGGHRSNPMPDLESAQNFGIATCVTSKFQHVFAISWSQGGHMSNLMPDLESA